MLKNHKWCLIEIIRIVFKKITYNLQYEGKRPKNDDF